LGEALLENPYIEALKTHPYFETLLEHSVTVN